jgi:asparagine synthase (glutamine-hydrolysing)
MFQGIRKLMPGHWLRLTTRGSRRIEIQQYWDVPAPGHADRRDDAEWIAECRQRLEETVRMRLMSDVPLGMFLSGGVDSSAIAALMKRMVSEPVKTFSVGYREAEFSELDYARRTAAALGTDHHEVLISMDDFFAALPKLVWHEDEPITWPSSVSLYFVAKLSAEYVKVVLTGEGSDELFAGYSRYRFYRQQQPMADAWRVLPGAVRRGVRDWIGSTSLLSSTVRRKLQHTFVGRGETLESLYVDNFYSAIPQSEQRGLLLPEFQSSPYQTFRAYWDSPGRSSTLSRMLYADQKTYLVELLMKQDQMSMACSIESRVPLLDHTFVEFAARVPDHLKIRGTSGKYILKRAVEDVVPSEVITRKKMGFPTPLRDWLQHDSAAPLFAALERRDSFINAYLDRGRVSELIARHRSGHTDATDRLWRLLNLQIWGDTFIVNRQDEWNGMFAASTHSAL